MIDGLQIRGDASEYEAAVLAAVVDQIRRRKAATRARRPKVAIRLSAWMRAGSLTNGDPLPRPDPGLNGDRAPTRPPAAPPRPRWDSAPFARNGRASPPRPAVAER